MVFKRNSIKTFGLFILSLASIVFLAIVYWNSMMKVLPILLILVALVSLCWLYIIYLKEMDETRLSNIINRKVEEERSKILADFNKKEEIVEEVKIDADELISKTIPKGNFKNIDSFVAKLLQNLAPEIEMSQGIFYLQKQENGPFEYLCGYAVTKEEISGFNAGENLTGQVVVTKEIAVIHDIPDSYMTIESGLGKSKPVNLVIVPVLNQNEVIAVFEMATFKSNTDHITEILSKLMMQVSDKLIQMIKS